MSLYLVAYTSRKKASIIHQPRQSQQKFPQQKNQIIKARQTIQQLRVHYYYNNDDNKCHCSFQSQAYSNTTNHGNKSNAITAKLITHYHTTLTVASQPQPSTRIVHLKPQPATRKHQKYNQNPNNNNSNNNIKRKNKAILVLLISVQATKKGLNTLVSFCLCYPSVKPRETEGHWEVKTERDRKARR